ncbi:MAG: dockerin type I domain-containing protein [Phycisphaerae bacterium]
MTASKRRFGFGVLAAWLMPMLALAQFPSDVVGFNQAPIDDPVGGQDTFRIPEHSGTTQQFIVLNTSGLNNNSAFRASGLQTEGDAALSVLFRWSDPLAADGWMRLTTFDAQVRPNPTLDTRGKVRFKVTNRSEFFAGTIGLALGIRETGVTGVPQLLNGGATGPLEWAGVSTTPNGITGGADNIVNTTASGDDVQVHPVGFDLVANNIPAGTAVIGVGSNNVLDTVASGDDQIRRGYKMGGTNNETRIPIPVIQLAPSPTAYAVEWNLLTGTVMVDGVPQGGGYAPFTGNGIADAPNFRGVLEHIAVVKGTGDTATQIEFAIDELQFEATVADPVLPPVIDGPVVDTDTSVIVICDMDATNAKLFRNAAQVGSVTPLAGVATFNALTLAVGDQLTATQTVNAITSAQSSPLTVFAAGTALADNFDDYVNQADLEGTWSLDIANTRKPLLSQGGASSCENFLNEDYDAGAGVAKLYYNLGSINGSDATPLWVSYRFRHDSNNTNARMRVELSAGLTPSDGAVGYAFSNGVAGLFPAQYTSLMYTSGAAITGYSADYFAYDYALTGVNRTPGIWHLMQIEVRSNVVNFYIDGALANPIDPADGVTPLYPTGVPRSNTGDYQYLIFGLGFSNNGPAMQYDDVSVTFGNTALPFGNPNAVASPSISGSPSPTATVVNLTGVDNAAQNAKVYANEVLIGTANGPFVGNAAAVTVTALANGAVLNATQTVGGTESCFSAGVTVIVPAPSLEPIIEPGQSSIEVRDISEGSASLISVYRDIGGGVLTLIGSAASPLTDRFLVPVSPAVEDGWQIVATQTISGVESAPSVAVTVASAGIMNEWVETTSMPQGLTGQQVVVLNGYIYVIGGRSNLAGQTTARNVVYVARINNDGTLGTWAETATLPAIRSHGGAAAYNGRIYYWGGWTTSFATTNSSYYAVQNPDGTLQAWQTSVNSLPNNLNGGIQMDACGRGPMIMGDTLYQISGEWQLGAAFGLTSNCYYSKIQPNGDYGPWVETTNVGTPAVGGCWFHGVATATGNGGQKWAYRLGGNYSGTNESACFRAPINPDGSLGAWVSDSPLPGGRYEHAVAVADGKYIFVINGVSNPGNSTIQRTVFVCEIDPDTGALSDWQTGLQYPETVAGRNAGVAYQAGGNWYVCVTGGGPFAGGVGGRTPKVYINRLNLGAPPCPGDVNGDRNVNLTDLATLLANFGTSSGAAREDGDLDNDGDVDLTDLASLLAVFGTTCP